MTAIDTMPEAGNEGLAGDLSNEALDRAAARACALPAASSCLIAGQ